MYGTALRAMAGLHAPNSYKIEGLQLLLDHGADVNAEGGVDGHALVAATATRGLPGSRASGVAVVNLLLEHGADANASEKSHPIPLHAAIFAEDVEILKTLLRARADHDLRVEGKTTPLEYARIMGMETMVIHLQDVVLREVTARTLPYDSTNEPGIQYKGSTGKAEEIGDMDEDSRDIMAGSQREQEQEE